MVQPKEEEEAPKEYEWLVHINEGFEVKVRSPDVEGALMQAFAEYWLKHPKPSLLVFDIQVLNLTLYNESKDGQS